MHTVDLLLVNVNTFKAGDLIIVPTWNGSDVSLTVRLRVAGGLHRGVIQDEGWIGDNGIAAFGLAVVATADNQVAVGGRTELGQEEGGDDKGSENTVQHDDGDDDDDSVLIVGGNGEGKVLLSSRYGTGERVL